jgi:hypothetical protein
MIRGISERQRRQQHVDGIHEHAEDDIEKQDMSRSEWIQRSQDLEAFAPCPAMPLGLPSWALTRRL